MTEQVASVSPPADSARRVRWWVRLPLLVVLGGLWLFVCAAVLLLTGTAGKSGGASWCVGAYLPVALLAWFVLAPARRRLLLSAGVAVVVALLGLGTTAIAPPSIERVEQASRALPVPSDAHLMSVDQYENVWCTQGCSHVERLYAVANGSASVAALEGALKADGWRAVQDRWCRGPFGVQVTLVPRDNPRFASQVPAPEGDEAMSVVTTAQC